MTRILSIFLGALFGIGGGIAAGALLMDFGSESGERLLAGALVGALCGLVGGTFGSDLAGKKAKNEPRNILGVTTGTITGALGAAHCMMFLQGLRLLSMQFTGMR